MEALAQKIAGLGDNLTDANLIIRADKDVNVNMVVKVYRCCEGSMVLTNSHLKPKKNRSDEHPKAAKYFIPDFNSCARSTYAAVYGI